jgi:Fur family ferric uptake transcriptional regulator
VSTPVGRIGLDELVDGLRSQGLRITAARRAICAVLAESRSEHLTAAALHDRAVARSGVSINSSTVYRTIEALQRLGLVRHAHLGHGPAVVHLVHDGGHHHLVCESCGRTEDLPPADVRAALSDLAERYRFVPETLHVSVIGICAACRAAG